jgi:hypothetical protein
MIGMVNQSGRYSPLSFKMTGTEGEDDWTCTATATHLETGKEVEGPPCSLKMAKDEGWYGRNGSKWQTMPGLMMRYRAGTFFARLYAPDLCMGMQSAEELNDVIPQRDATPAGSTPGGGMFPTRGMFTDPPAAEGQPPIDISEPPLTTNAENAVETPPDGGEEEVQDPRVDLLQEVICKITESAAPTPELDREFKERGIFGTKKSSVGRLGVDKLQQIIDEWDAIERMALSRNASSDPSNTELL